MATATPALVEPSPTTPPAPKHRTTAPPVETASGRPVRTVVPGRARVVVWTVIVAAVGMLAVLLGSAWALQAANAQHVNEAIAREVGEVRRFATAQPDPATGQPIATAPRFVELYLDQEVPDRSELLVGAGPGEQPRERRGDRTVTFGNLDADVRTRILAPGRDSAWSSGAGRLTWETVEIQTRDGAAVIAVVRFHSAQQAAVLAQLGLLTLVALASLCLTGVTAWVVAGQLKGPTRLFEEAVATATTGPDLAYLPERGDEEYVRLARAANTLVAGAAGAYGRETQLHHDLARQLEQPLADLLDTLETARRAQPARARALTQGIADVRRVQNIIADLTLLHRVELPGLIEPQPAIALTEFVEILVDVWQARPVEFGAPTVRVAQGECDPAAHATFDEPWLARAVDELLANAVQASAPGETVWLSTGVWRDDRGEWVRLDVTDTGRGVPAGEREFVLERFARASNDPSPGTGLGLTVAHRLVTAMGGTLTLTAHDGPGTTARIVLPVTGAAR